MSGLTPPLCSSGVTGRVCRNLSNRVCNIGAESLYISQAVNTGAEARHRGLHGISSCTGWKGRGPHDTRLMVHLR